jgi:hypothetical protein
MNYAMENRCQSIKTHRKLYQLRELRNKGEIRTKGPTKFTLCVIRPDIKPPLHSDTRNVVMKEISWINVKGRHLETRVDLIHKFSKVSVPLYRNIIFSFVLSQFAQQMVLKKCKDDKFLSSRKPAEHYSCTHV